MKLPLTWALLLIAALFYPLKAGQDTLFVTCSDGKSRAIGVHIPKHYKKSNSWPLVLWLHGGVNGTRQNKGAEVAHYFAKESDSLGFFFAAPSGERGATWMDETGIETVKLSLKKLEEAYHIDPKRIVLAGVSDGGTGAYLASVLYPDAFAGYAVLSASFELPGMLGAPLTAASMKNKQWLIAHGGKDHLYPGEAVKAWVAGMKKAGVTIHFQYYSEAPHGLDYMPLLRDTLLSFFVKTRL